MDNSQYKENTIEYRSALISNDSSNPSATGRYLNIIVGRTLPLTIVADTVLDDQTVTKKVTTSVVAPTNTLEDISNDSNLGLTTGIVADRFTYVGSTQSVITNSTVDIIYDNTFKDILIIPILEQYGDGATGNPMNDTVYTTTGCRIGGGSVINEVYKGDVGKAGAFTLPVVNKLTSTTNIITNLFGLANNNGQKKTVRNIVNDTDADAGLKVFDGSSLPASLISLGTGTDLFKTSVPVPVYSINYHSFNNGYVLNFLQDKIVKDAKLYTVLDF